MSGASEAASDLGLAPGALVAEKYRVECLLAESGQAVVLAAWDEVLDRPVVLKILPSINDARSVSRFVREARAVARLESEHVVRVLDVVTLPGGEPLMVLERLDGADLAALLERGGPMKAERIADYVLQACAGLAQAHAVGIIHRDIKPQNLFLASRPDGTTVVKVLDFGIAKSEGGIDEKTLTGSFQILGTPAYMAPEQIDDPKRVDARADIWSLGVVIYKLATGRAPFAGETLTALLASIGRGEIAPFGGARDEASLDLERVVTRCLSRDPEKRYPTVLALAEDLAPLATARGEQAVERIAFITGEPRSRSEAPAAPAPVTAAAPLTAPVTPAAASSSRTPRAALAGIGAAAVLAIVVWAATRGGADPADEVVAPAAPAAPSISSTHGAASAASGAAAPSSAVAAEASSDPPEAQLELPAEPSSSSSGAVRAAPRSKGSGGASTRRAPPPQGAPSAGLPKVLGGRL